MTFPQYCEYKDSEFSVLGAIPVRWNISTLKRIVSDISSGVSVNAADEPVADGAIGVLKTSCVYSGRFDAAENKKVVPDEVARVACPVTSGSLIVSRMNTPSLVGAAGLVHDDSPNLFLPDRLWRVRFTDALPKFVHYWTLTPQYRAQVQVACAGTSSSMQNLSQDEFLMFRIPLPAREEQSAIATFLDRETAKIDALIAEQERLLELLDEKRQAVISHAVTKGLNLDAPMKDSGVAWLGDVPAHWGVMPIRLAARLESGHTPSRSREDWWENCTVPWFSLADVWQIRQGADVIYETSEKVSELGLANSSARVLPKGTVMLSRTASVGFSAIMGVDMATTQDFANWICGPRLSPDFLLWVFRSMQGELRRLMMGSTHNTIYMPDIQSLRFALPPMEEQRLIVAYVRDSLRVFAELESEAKRGIELLKERRSALIAAAVTGQIDVRDAA